MIQEDQEINNPTPVQANTKTIWVVTIIICALIIGLSIVGAGLIIAKEIARQNRLVQQPPNSAPSELVDLSIPADAISLGKLNAKVTMIEFADYTCPYCLKWHSSIFNKLKEEYIDTGKVRFIYWDFAFLSEKSVRAAEAASCAADQGRYWEYHQELFDNQESFIASNNIDSYLNSLASKLVMDKKAFQSCLQDNKYTEKIKEYLNKASAVGVSSTPTVTINGIKLEGAMPWQNYQQIIESELNK